MPLLKLDSVHLQYGTQVLLDAVSLNITRGEKLGLLGRNGAGKTTLLKLLAGELNPDSGERWIRPGVRIARLQQTLPEADEVTVFDAVAAGLADAGRLVSEYHHLLQADPPADLADLSRVQQQLEAADGWQLQQRVETTISQLQLPAEAAMGELSGGWRRRVALAQACLLYPSDAADDVLCVAPGGRRNIKQNKPTTRSEPSPETNHTDTLQHKSIEQLQNYPV